MEGGRGPQRPLGISAPAVAAVRSQCRVSSGGEPASPGRDYASTMDLHRHLTIRSLALLILVLATYFSALQARHHKIRHARQKKIVNNAKFVPVYYVVLDERPDLGPWGEWSAPGSCSRSCGGGVAFQSRNCRPGSTCQGPAKRYFSCNTMHCPPGSKDFRSEQCSKFDTLEFERILHKWIPYTKGANNCELNCLPRGKLLDVFTKKVIDGTRCNDETLDVCVEGRCMPVGCDLFLGSSLREDKCRKCGGDNSGCITVSKIISFETDLSDAQRGYNDLLLIPAGATNIFIRELKHAENYLAIRNENNTYYLNGNFIIDDPKDFHFAGTVFHYERQPEGILLGSAVIRALGPTNESLYIALLYQEDRRGEGIEYEYSFSNKEVQSGDPDNFYWVTHDFSECSAPCGGGSHNRKLGCAKKSDNSAVSLRFCNPVGRPATTHGCNEHPCDPEWFISSWSNCTDPCKGGMQFRQVYCLQKISNTRLAVMEDDVCVKKLLGEKPSATHNQPCNKECEEGKQYRKVTCSDTSDSTAKTTESTTISSEATTPKSEPTSSQMVHPVTTTPESHHSSCQQSRFGCCQDMLTPAHGPNREGCCINSQYGCCPDNILPAGGPSLQGCVCTQSTFSCCPNGVDYAKGTNKEGCGCRFTDHGCCPDGFSEAGGPDFKGCSCKSFQFGCCPDGKTVAKGPANAGCTCKDTEFGCCPDNVTSAQGEDFKGCGCVAAEFGCCLDGVSEAKGEKFEECAATPIFSGEACALPKERGVCRNFSVQWFYDAEYGGCTRFWYSGCDGNDNRFESLEECKNSCVNPEGNDACFLPKIHGPCDGSLPSWYYDSERKHCTQFIYGGCLGNNNRFQTLEECQQLCAHQEIKDKCAQPVSEGPCNGNYKRWYFDSDDSTCKRFRFGGCKGNHNNFLTEAACQQQCVAPALLRDVCNEPMSADERCASDQKLLARWRFDVRENRCLPFYTKGCDVSSRNTFVSEPECEDRCPKEIDEKPGVCPTMEEADNCTHTCGEDADCGGGDKKCCYNGCAYQCLNPSVLDVSPPLVTTTQAPEPEHQTTPALQIHPNCTDTPMFAPCKLIVKAKYCSHKYYSRFCCRSCTEDGQLPLDGIHLYGGSSRKRY
ncbi:Hypothetical predicted protein [Cloeon dipterum]|uniref:Papilin n=1 Tax=Cloeon dipterum TaxID=197152 RepID=A0A8S1DID4_9INSE|nr:Hypothetical predicted protein [Cloeon dipterum]